MYLDFQFFHYCIQPLQLSVSRSIYYSFALLPYQSCTSTEQDEEEDEEEKEYSA